MKAFLSVVSFALALIPAVALAQQPAVCQRVEFSQEVLARFPNIRKACLDVINKDGQEYAVVKADLVRATARRMTVRVKLPDGTHSDPIGINIKSNARVNVDGQPTRARRRSQLARSFRLTSASRTRASRSHPSSRARRWRSRRLPPSRNPSRSLRPQPKCRRPRRGFRSSVPSVSFY